jgi:hypothetical protein
MAKVSEVMVTTFQTESVHRVMAPDSEVVVAVETEYLVMTAENEQPVSLLPAAQVGSLPREGEKTRFSVVPVVSEDIEVEEAVWTLTPQLLERPDLAGAVVLLNGEIRGVLPRSLIAEQFRYFLANRSLTALGYPQVYGDPDLPATIYSCPQGDYREKVEDYDIFDPPRCPVHQEILVRTA